jgi:23S rRNA (cytosine1962-C5)-methyltransferase
MPSPADCWELVDAGDERRLERFGGTTVDRPAPTALGPRRDPAAWSAADAVFAAGSAPDGGRWGVAAPLPDPWLVVIDDLTLELRLTEAGQVGLFPEHAGRWSWLRERVMERAGLGPVNVLHLFAYTGGATLVMAKARASVVHVDASRPAITWARRNAERSGLAAVPIRWLVDDAATFVARERRRGRRYDGVVLDPPTYGHGPNGQPWRLAEDLGSLLEACAAVLDPDGFALERLGGRLAAARRISPTAVEVGDLVLEARSGVRLHLGAWAGIGGPR